MSSKVYYRGQDWWNHENPCRHDAGMECMNCYKCQHEQFFNSHLMSLAYIFLKLELTNKSLVPDADPEFVLDFLGNRSS